jgi:serine incorporator 1/3
VRPHLQLFFTSLSLILLGVKLKSDKRATFLMSGSPAIKLGFWIIFNIFPFLLPNNVVLAYGYVARAGSALFLVIQLLLLLDCVLTMNERWVAAAEEDERNYKGMLAITVGCYVACLVLVGTASATKHVLQGLPSPDMHLVRVALLLDCVHSHALGSVPAM